METLDGGWEEKRVKKIDEAKAKLAEREADLRGYKGLDYWDFVLEYLQALGEQPVACTPSQLARVEKTEHIIWNNVANLFFQQCELPKTRRALERAEACRDRISKDEYSVVRFNLAVLCETEGAIEDKQGKDESWKHGAITHLVAALEANPHNQEADFMLCRLKIRHQPGSLFRVVTVDMQSQCFGGCLQRGYCRAH